MKEPKIQDALWWITSIAVSVVCCSVLFILFASYLVDMKADVKDVNARLAAIEAREQIVASKYTITKPAPSLPVDATPALAAPVAAPEIPASPAATNAAPDNAPQINVPSVMTPDKP